MRKYPVLLLALVLLFGASAIFAVRAMDAPKDQIAFTEDVVYGDPAAADGLTVSLTEQLRYHYRWDSTVSFTDRSYAARTAFSFEQSTQSWYRGDPEPYSLDITDGIASGYDVDAETPISAAITALEKTVQPGTTASSLLRVADYYETYPLFVNITLPDCFLGSGSGVDGPEQAAVDGLTAFFQIPVLPDQYLSVEVSKSVDGMNSIGMSSADCGDSFYLYTNSAATDDAFYFWFSNRSANGKLADTSRIPGGYGIYRLPFGRVDTDAPYKGQPNGWQGYDVFTDQLSCFYPVDPEAEIRQLSLSADQTRLYLQTVEDGRYFISVLDTASGALLQRCELAPYDSDDWCEYEEGENFLFIRFSDRRFFVFVPTEDGLLRQALHVELSELERSDDYCPWYSTHFRSMAWRDGRFVIVCNSSRTGAETEWYYAANGCGFSVSVYENDALAYYGLYDSTLDQANPPGAPSDNDSVQPPYIIPAEASFTE